ncbi:hypothetical protein AB1N83_007841 [Pleurotus pulmonarius]
MGGIKRATVNTVAAGVQVYDRLVWLRRRTQELSQGRRFALSHGSVSAAAGREVAGGLKLRIQMRLTGRSLLMAFGAFKLLVATMPAASTPGAALFFANDSRLYRGLGDSRLVLKPWLVGAEARWLESLRMWREGGQKGGVDVKKVHLERLPQAREDQRPSIR